MSDDKPTRWTRERIVPPHVARLLPPHPIEFRLGDHDDGRACARCGFSIPSGFKHAHYAWCEARTQDDADKSENYGS